MTQAEMQAEIERLTADNAKLAARATSKLTIRVAKSGGVSVYGLSRWPVTLYQEQWDRLLAMKTDVLAFIAEHQGELTLKGEKVAAAA